MREETFEFFFDSWGGLWQTCSPQFESAEAFGPVGSAARVEPEDACLYPLEGETTYTAARRLGAIVRDSDSDWEWLSTWTVDPPSWGPCPDGGACHHPDGPSNCPGRSPGSSGCAHDGVHR